MSKPGSVSVRFGYYASIVTAIITITWPEMIIAAILFSRYFKNDNHE